MVEVLLKEPTSGSNKIAIDEEQRKDMAKELNVSELIANLKKFKNEEQELLRQKKELLATENELRNQAIEEIDAKEKVINGLKSEVAFLQNKCTELEQALGITSLSIIPHPILFTFFCILGHDNEKRKRKHILAHNK